MFGFIYSDVNTPRLRCFTTMLTVQLRFETQCSKASKTQSRLVSSFFRFFIATSSWLFNTQHFEKSLHSIQLLPMLGHARCRGGCLKSRATKYASSLYKAHFYYLQRCYRGDLHRCWLVSASNADWRRKPWKKREQIK